MKKNIKSTALIPPDGVRMAWDDMIKEEQEQMKSFRKVYLVFGDNYEYEDLIAAFTEEELTVEFRCKIYESQDYKGYNDFLIKEIELNKYFDFVKNGFMAYHVYLDLKTNDVEFVKSSPVPTTIDLDDEDCFVFEQHFRNETGTKSKNKEHFCFYCEESSEEQAIKKALEKREFFRSQGVNCHEDFILWEGNQ